MQKGAWTASVGAQLPVTVSGRRIGTALVCDDGSLHVHVDDSELARSIGVADSRAAVSLRGLDVIVDEPALPSRPVSLLHPPADIDD